MFPKAQIIFTKPELKLGQHRTGVRSVWSRRHFSNCRWHRPSSLKISAQIISVAQNYSQHSQSGDEFNWLYHAYLNRKIKKYLWKKKKDETKNGNFCKNWLCQNFSCCPKDLSCPKFGGGRVGSPQLPRPVRLWVLYHLFRQSNTLKFQINFISVRRLVKAWLCVVKSAW